MNNRFDLPPLNSEGSFSFSGKTLYHSQFNVGWLDAPKIILDVGACDFGDSIRFKNTFPECQIYAFEMMDDNYKKYSEFAESNGIKTYNIAISNYDGLTDYYKSNCTTGLHAQSTLLKPGDGYKNMYGHMVSHKESIEKVSCKTINTFCKENSIDKIDLLHIDVEGAEFKVIQGIGDVKPDLIFAEFLIDGGWENQASFNETLDLIYSLGYKKIKDLPHDKLFRLEKE